ncbi:MAG: PAS domain S-box protein [Burkholderiales bacterium]|nr:PAS domain S-box protein [Burkholderiales bacterium]
MSGSAPPPARPAALVRGRGQLLLAAVLAALAIVLLVGAGVRATFRGLRETETARLAAVAELRVGQVAGWLQQREASAQFVAQHRPWGDLFRRQRAGDAAAAAALAAQLTDYAHAHRAQAGVLVAADMLSGVAAVTGLPVFGPETRVAAERALRTGRPQRTDFAGSEAEGGPWIDLVAPLPEGSEPARAVVVLRFDLRTDILPMLATWPVPSESAQSRLVRVREGMLVGVRAAASQPLARSDNLVARVARREAPAGQVIEAVDFRGTPVLGMVRSVPGTDWYLSTTVARRDLLLQSLRQSAWIGASGVLALMMVGAGAYLLRARHALQLALHAQAERQREELRRDEEAARRLIFFEHSRDAVFVVDQHARVLEANASFLQLLGLDAEALEALHVWEFDPNYPRERALSVMSMVFPERQTFETRWRARSGAMVDVEISVNRVQAGGRRLVLCVARDITARKSADQMLRKLSLAVEQNPNGIVIMDTEGRIEYVNEAFERISGWRRSEVLGRNPRLEAAQQVNPEFHAAMMALGDKREGWSGEHIEYRKNGEPYHEYLSVLPLREPDGSVTHFVAIEEDITERKRIEAELARHREHLEEVVAERTQALQQAVQAHAQSELRLQALNEQLVSARDRAEAANRAKTAFLANMSHEIRTPMNAIIGLTHLMQRDQRSPADAERLNKVAEAAHHLLDVINDVLDLSKIESGKLRLERTEFPIDAVLGRCCALLAERARAKGLELVIDVDGVPPSLVGDPTRLSQALLNLMSNAVKFTEQGWVRLRCEWLDTLADGRIELRFSVQDTGLGVPADKLGGLFRAFEQADSSTTRRFGGTGLGLAITRRLAQLMGGEVGVESILGAGSRFWFTACLERGVLEEAPPIAAAGQGPRVLLVEDLAPAREAITSMLERQHLKVLAVDTLDQAMAKLRSAPPGPADETGPAVEASFALLVCEWPLPDAGELFNAAAVRQAATLPDLRCVALCATDEARQAQTALEAGFDLVLAKPVTYSGLRDGLQRLLQPASVKAGASATAGALAERPDFGGLRVLLAEDNGINQEVAVELLKAVGLQVDVAANGLEAVACAQDGDYALILMDVQMPVLDGLGATREIRALPDHRQTPILAMTANAFGDDREACLAAGMNDHIGKPVDPQVLYAALSRWMPTPAPAVAAGAAAPAAGEPADDGSSPAVRGPSAGPVAGAERASLAPAEAGAPALSIPGITMSRALLYLPGRNDVFLRVLQQFTENYADALAGLAPLLAARQYGQARALVHALRGACGAIGATALLASAEALEQMLKPEATERDPDRVVTAAHALQGELAALLAAIRQQVEPGDALPTASVPAEQVEAACETMDHLLRVADFSANARLRELMPLLRAGLGQATTHRMDEALRRYDHEAALAALRAKPPRPAEGPADPAAPQA